ncbi:MAG: HAD family hydrolase [Thermoplasmatota archaeon]
MVDRIRYNGVLFDLGNTLLPFGWNELSEFVKGWYEEAARVNDRIPFDLFIEAYRSVIREEWRIKRSRPWETNPATRASMVAEQLDQHDMGGDDLKKILASTHTPVFQSCLRFPKSSIEFLSRLRPGEGPSGSSIRMGLISNAADSTAIRNCLKIYDADRFFDVISVSEEEGEAKPWPGIFERALGVLGLEGSDCVYVGDRYKVDVLGARNAGMEGIYYRQYETRGEPPEGVTIDSPIAASLDQLYQLLLS